MPRPINIFSFKDIKGGVLKAVLENSIVVEKDGEVKEYYINAIDLKEILGAEYYDASGGKPPVRKDVDIVSEKAESFLYLSNEPYYLTGLPVKLINGELLKEFENKKLKHVSPIVHEERMLPGLAEYVILGLEDKNVKYNLILTPKTSTFSMVKARGRIVVYPDYSILVERCLSNHYVIGMVSKLPEPPEEWTGDQIEELRFLADQWVINIFDKNALRRDYPDIYKKIYENDAPLAFPEKYKPVYGKTWEECIIRPTF